MCINEALTLGMKGTRAAPMATTPLCWLCSFLPEPAGLCPESSSSVNGCLVASCNSKRLFWNVWPVGLALVPPRIRRRPTTTRRVLIRGILTDEVGRPCHSCMYGSRWLMISRCGFRVQTVSARHVCTAAQLLRISSPERETVVKACTSNLPWQLRAELRAVRASCTGE